MFFFKEAHVAGILDGTKTQTRRMHLSPRARVGSIHQCRTVMMRRDSCFARIKILRVWPEELRDISDEDAIAEGGYTREEYIAKLVEITKGEVQLDTALYCYEFELVGEGLGED